jgi:hypothetical protein
MPDAPSSPNPEHPGPETPSPETPGPETSGAETQGPETPSFGLLAAESAATGQSDSDQSSSDVGNADQPGEGHAGAAPPKRLGFVLIALVFLALVLGVRWWYVTSQALGEVFVEASQPSCTKTTVGEAKINGQVTAAPETVPGMRCEVTVNIVNPGAVGVRISKLVAPGLGPESGLPVQAVTIDNRAPQDAGEDAEYDVDQKLGPSDLIEINIAYEFREGGCIAGDTFTSSKWPTVEATMSKRTKNVSAERGFALTSTPESRC